MKRYFSVLLLAFAVGLSSCLKAGLDENLPKFKDAFITDVFMEYRFEDATAVSGGSPVVRIVNLNLSEKNFKRIENTPGAATDSVVFDVTVPATTATFPTSERDKVTPANIVLMANISTAATMAAVEGSPRPGTPGDFSQPRKYQVIAADGTVRTWTVKINNFIK